MKFRVLAFAALAILGACAADPTSPNDQSVEGTYMLRSINGSPLPVIFQNGANKGTLTADALTITDGGTWVETATWLIAGQSQVASYNGTYSRVGAAFSFYNTVTRLYDNAVVNGRTVTFADGNRVFTR